MTPKRPLTPWLQHEHSWSASLADVSVWLMHEDLHQILQRWRLITKFRLARHEHDRLCRRDKNARDMELVNEFASYWQKQQLANMWQTARRLSGTGPQEPTL